MNQSKKLNFMKAVLWVLRIIVGSLFIFSGVVKANDPLGLTYKTQEFFEKMGLDFLHDYTLPLSIIMITLEIVAGVAVLIGYKMKKTGILLLALISFFTFLTAYALFVKGPDGTPIIKECGCFGDCIKMTNWETFMKNLVLLAFIIILYSLRSYIKPLFNTAKGRTIVLGAALITLAAQWYVLRHLPFVDCLPYKVGAYLPDLMTVPEDQQPVIENVFIYEKDGKQEEFTVDNLPDDSWTFVDRIDKVIKEGTSEPAVKDFVISDINAEDITSYILETPETTHLWMIKDLGKAKEKSVKQALELYESAVQNNEYMYLVANSSTEGLLEFREKYNIPTDMELCTLDGVTMKTALRANEGIMSLKEGTITEKYASADFHKHLK